MISVVLSTCEGLPLQNHLRTRADTSCPVQVWELFGSFLANETFAREMDMSLAAANESAIPHVESNPKLRDGFQKPVREACSPRPSPYGFGIRRKLLRALSASMNLLCIVLLHKHQSRCHMC